MARKHKLPTPPRRSWGAVSSKLTPLKGDAKAMEKYLDAVESGIEDYLVGDTYNGSFWIGGGAAAAGKRGQLRKGELTGLLLGRPLDQLANEDAELVVSKSRKLNGWDVELFPPKPFSVAAAVSSRAWREALLRIHLAAVAKAVEAVDEAIGTRRGAQGLGEWQRAAGLTAVQTLHMASREDDPHFHTHLTISNRVLTWDGKTLTIDSEMFHDAWPLAVTVYGRELRRLSAELLGIEWAGPDAGGHFTMPDVPEITVKKFSKRTDVIEAYMLAHPGVDEDWASRVTRPKKNLTESALEKFARWREEAAALAPEWVKAMLAKRPPLAMRLGGLNDPLMVPLPQPASDLVTNMVIKTAAEVITKRVAVWDIIEARQTVCELAPQSWTWEQVCDTAAALMARRDLVCELGTPAAGGLDSIRPGGPRMATWELLEAEDAVTEFFRGDQPQRPNIEASIRAGERAIGRAYFRDGQALDDSQAAAVRAIAAGGHGHVIIGPAGTGKTTVFATISEWARRLGMDMVGMAAAQSAADLIGSSMGCLGINTTRGLAQDVIPDNGLVVLDEASMVNTLQMAAVIEAAKAKNSIVVLVGDPEQLGAVEGPGGMLDALAADPDIDVNHLEVPWRFNHQWEREASLQLRAQNPDVLDTYLEHGRVEGLTPNIPLEQTERRVIVGAERLADKVVDRINAGHKVIVSTTSNDEADLINTNIQRKLFPARETEVVKCAGKAMRIGVGDRIITRRNAFKIRTTMDKPIINGKAWTVDAISGGELKLTSVDPEVGSVILPREYLDQLPEPGQPRAIQLGWASTTHVAQGRTEEMAIGLINPNTTTAEGLHVMGTRGQELNLFVVYGDQNDAEDAFRSAIGRSRAPIAATQAEDELTQRPTPRQQRRPHPAGRGPVHPVQEQDHRSAAPRAPPARASPGHQTPDQALTAQQPATTSGQPPAPKRLRSGPTLRQIAGIDPPDDRDSDLVAHESTPTPLTDAEIEDLASLAPDEDHGPINAPQAPKPPPEPAHAPKPPPKAPKAVAGPGTRPATPQRPPRRRKPPPQALPELLHRSRELQDLDQPTIEAKVANVANAGQIADPRAIERLWYLLVGLNKQAAAYRIAQGDVHQGDVHQLPDAGEDLGIDPL